MILPFYVIEYIAQADKKEGIVNFTTEYSLIKPSITMVAAAILKPLDVVDPKKGALQT